MSKIALYLYLFFIFETTNVFVIGELKFSTTNSINNEVFEFGDGSLFFASSLRPVDIPSTSFNCIPDSSEHNLRWTSYDGSEIGTGDSFSSTDYYVTSQTDGVVTLHIGNSNGLFVREDKVGKFTCSYGNDSISLGIYHPRVISELRFRGIRLITNDVVPIIKDFTPQRGDFELELNKYYTIVGLGSSPNTTDWDFVPKYDNQPTVFPNTDRIDNVFFKIQDEGCQKIYANDTELFITVSNKPFIIKDPDDGDFTNFTTSSCISNGSIGYTFSVGEVFNVKVTCPLVFNPYFIDIAGIALDTTSRATDESHFNQGINERRLWTDGSQQVAIQYERDYECKNIFNVSAVFRIEVYASEGIEIFPSTNATSPLQPDVTFIESMSGIPSTVYCLFEINGATIKWLSDFSVDQSVITSLTEVMTNTSEQIYTFEYRKGRTHLNIAFLEDNSEGWYYCRNDESSLSKRIGLFKEQPIAPMAALNTNMAHMEVIISMTSGLLTCSVTNINSVYPTETVVNWVTTDANITSLSIDLASLTVENTGTYICVASNRYNYTSVPIFLEVKYPAPVLNSHNLTELEIFVGDQFEFTCTFTKFRDNAPNITIKWYKNSLLLENSQSGIIISEEDLNSTTYISRLTLTYATIMDTGLYSCNGSVEPSDETSQSALVTIGEPYLPDVIPLQADPILSYRFQLNWNATNRFAQLPETYIIYHCGEANCQYIQSPLLASGTLSYAITRLLELTNYRVILSATNRFGTTNSTDTFETDVRRRFFYYDSARGNAKIHFASGSLFLGGAEGTLEAAVSEFYCDPVAPSDSFVEWLDPSGAKIQEGVNNNTIYYTVNPADRISTLFINEGLTSNNDGNNFTCVINSSAQLQYHRFGIAYQPQLANSENIFGIRLYSDENLPIVQEYVLQKGTFDFNFTKEYKFQCLKPLGLGKVWKFIPKQTGINTALFNVFLNEAVLDLMNLSCLIIGCDPRNQFIALSNETFLLDESDTFRSITKTTCIRNREVAFTFKIGDPLKIGVSCPLVFGAKFINLPSDFSLVKNEVSQVDSSRLIVNSSSTFALLKYEREYICEDQYRTQASFRVEIVSQIGLKVYNSTDTQDEFLNGQNIIISEIGVASLQYYCLYENSNTELFWYRDLNINRYTNSNDSEWFNEVTLNGSSSLHMVQPRGGRTDLYITMFQSQDNGHYRCGDGSNQFNFQIYLQTPVSPVAEIRNRLQDIVTGSISVELSIDDAEIVLVCNDSNSENSYPNEVISFWDYSGANTSNSALKSVISMVDLVESNGIDYICIVSNVFSYNSAKITLISIPPPPLLVNSNINMVKTSYIESLDNLKLYCLFSTISTVSSEIQILWIKDGSIITDSNEYNISTSRNGLSTNSTLTIKIASTNTGTYSCQAKVGRSELSVFNTQEITIYGISEYAISINASSACVNFAEITLEIVNKTYQVLTYTIYYRKSNANTYNMINTNNSTVTLTHLDPNSEYFIFVSSVDQFNEVKYSSEISFTTSVQSVYFIEKNNRVYFSNGSLFRGGHSQIPRLVIQYYCQPANPSDRVEWFNSAGVMIQKGPLSNNLYYVDGSICGEKILITTDRMSDANAGNYFTCRIEGSGNVFEHTFGINYIADNSGAAGIRLTNQNNVIYELLNEYGSYAINLNDTYTAECLESFTVNSKWEFNPSIIQYTQGNLSTPIMYGVKFNSTSTCQEMRCGTNTAYARFSDRPFLVESNQNVCYENNSLNYFLTVGDILLVDVTCPFTFRPTFSNSINSEFLLSASGRRLYTDTLSAKVFISHEGLYYCQNKYGITISFTITANGIAPISVYSSDRSVDSLDSDTVLAGDTGSRRRRQISSLPPILYCISNDVMRNLRWYKRTALNNTEFIKVPELTSESPHQLIKRNARTDLIVGDNGLAMGESGDYYCIDLNDSGVKFKLSLYKQEPIIPEASIFPAIAPIIFNNSNPSTLLQVECLDSGNSTFPNEIEASWNAPEITHNEYIDLTSLIEDNSGNYTCTVKNIYDSSSTIISIIVIPHHPNFLDSNFGLRELFQGDKLTLWCSFEKFKNVTSPINIQWHKSNLAIDYELDANVNITTNANNLVSTSMLFINSADSFHSGYYSCLAKAGESSIQATPISANVSIFASYYPDEPFITEIYGNNNSITIIWSGTDISDMSLTTEETYNIYYCLETEISTVVDDCEFILAAMNSYNTTYTLLDLQSGTTYKIIIEASNRFGSVNSSISNFTTAITNKPTPSENFQNIALIVGPILVIILLSLIILVTLLLIIVICLRRRRTHGSFYSAKKLKELPEIQYSYKKSEPIVRGFRNEGMENTLEIVDISQLNSAPSGGEHLNSEEAVSNLIDHSLPFISGDNETIYNEHVKSKGYESSTDARAYTCSVDEFPQRVLQYHLRNNEMFTLQYESLPKHFINDITTGSTIKNKVKNRFANIIPYEHTRVILNHLGEENDDYINANYIDGYYAPKAYIAAQGPLIGTVNDFWRMIWEQKVEFVVALTKVMENEKRKCEPYWPNDEGSSARFGEILVTLIKMNKYTSYDVREMQATNSTDPDNTIRKVTQFHYTLWPDHGAPIFSNTLLNLIKYTKSLRPAKDEGPPLLVHCSAGVGRTGSFIVLDHTMEELNEAQHINIYKKITTMRESRCHIVQSKEQYIFTHDAIADLIRNTQTTVVKRDFKKYYEEGVKYNPSTNKTKFQEQFEYLNTCCRLVENLDIRDALRPENATKNNDSVHVPFDLNRVTIIPDPNEDQNYINASFTHSYSKQQGYIAAQGPNGNTIYDFWRMIERYRISLVVMLTRTVENSKLMCANYIPEVGHQMTINNSMVIQNRMEEIFEDFIDRRIYITTVNGGINLTVQHLEFTKWPEQETPPVLPFLRFYNHYTKLASSLAIQNTPIVIHCNDGCNRTGCFIACLIAIDQMEQEKSVDIFQIVNTLRSARPEMVSTAHLYTYCHEVVLTHLQQFDTYENLTI